MWPEVALVTAVSTGVVGTVGAVGVVMRRLRCVQMNLLWGCIRCRSEPLTSADEVLDQAIREHGGTEVMRILARRTAPSLLSRIRRSKRSKAETSQQNSPQNTTVQGHALPSSQGSPSQ